MSPGHPLMPTACVEVMAADVGTVGSLAFRQLWPGDAPFIFDSWLKSYRRSPDVEDGRLRGVPGPVYRDGQHALVARLLERCGAAVAYNPRIPEQVYGWLVAELVERVLLVHYVYVKQPFRRFGIARGLLSEAGAALSTQHTHRTELGEHLVRRLGSTFNPYAR